MRDLYRLNKFYERLKEIHKYYPDWRFSQMMVNFFNWHQRTYKNDGYYVEDKAFLIRLEQYMKEIGVIKDVK